MRNLLLLLAAQIIALGAMAQAPTIANTEALKKKYNNQLQKQNTVVFEENKGQMKDQHWQPRPDVLYYGSSEGMHYYIRNNGMSYQLSRVESWKEEEEDKHRPTLTSKEKRKVPDQIGTYRVDAAWQNHNPNYTVTKGQALEGYNNYYNVPEGVEPALYVKQYEAITLKDLWNGIDVHYYGTSGHLETDYLVAPGADYKQIQIEITGAELSTDHTGTLTMKTPFGEIQEGALKVYQNNQLLNAQWVITPTTEGYLVSFDIPDHNPALAMRIDPLVRVWGTYYGGISLTSGSGHSTDYGIACSTDPNGNVYLSGETNSSTNIATIDGHENTFPVGGVGGGYFLAKFNSNGVRLWGTYYSGGLIGSDMGKSCATDAMGNVYITGGTMSPVGIAFNGHKDTLTASPFSNMDAFLVKFNSNGIRQWATYYGGENYDYGKSCAVDGKGNVYLAGVTSSSSSIAHGGHQLTYGGGYFARGDAFLVKFNSNGVRQWATYYGGSDDEFGMSCATDNSGNVYLAGTTLSSSRIASSGHQNVRGSSGHRDAFLVKFDSTGVRQWGTYYGGYSDDYGYSCATDSLGNVYLSGQTYSDTAISFLGHMNVKNCSYSNCPEAFLVKFNSGGVRQWATYYGGERYLVYEDFSSCATDNRNNVYLTGRTKSTSGIFAVGYQDSFGGVWDAFIVKFNSFGVRQWGTYYGGAGEEIGNSCSLDFNGNVYMAGSTSTLIGLASGGHLDTALGTSDAFLVKFKQPKLYGVVWQDVNNNCTIDVTEPKNLSGITLTIQPGNYVTQAIGGVYSIDSLPAGTYTVTVDTSNTNWRLTCPVSQTFTVTDPNGETLAPDFGFKSKYACPKPEVSITMPRMRRGFNNQLIYVNACNLNTATDTMGNAYVEVELPSFITVQGASRTYTNLGNNKYRVNLGTLNIGQCENFTFTATVTTAAVANQTLCLKAALYPQADCVFDSVPTPYQPGSPVSPCTQAWDRSSLKVSARCVGDSVRFVIYNTGSASNGNMQCYAPIRIYVDGQLTVLDSIRINGGDSVVIMYPGNAQTIRLEADQHPLHPGKSRPNASIENCGTGFWTHRIINTMPQDDADPIVDIFCGEVSAPYDPNDKTGYPLGVSATHNILQNQDIEYLIRFQNIGTDTAVNVVILDTLTTDLDIFSVRSGVSSHPYEFRMYGPRVLEWKFNNIMLPDSFTNEPASNGFVKFTVKQNKDLPYGTVIENTANIYFDFEAPVVTNTYFHTVAPPQQPIIASAASISPTVCINTALPTITITTSGATGIGTPIGLPAGVTATYAANTITISGTPTTSGIFNYIIPLIGGYDIAKATGKITVKENKASSLTNNPSTCINTALPITIQTTIEATGIGTPSNLPNGVVASWSADTITISGTPTISGVFNYIIPLTGGCGAVSAIGTINVNSENTAISSSNNPTLCINALNQITTHSTTGATGIGTTIGLAPGLTATFSGNMIRLSGIATQAGTFNYSVPLTGGCGSISATGTITVNPNNTASAISNSPTVCINTTLPSFTHTTTGATGIGTPANLPNGVSASWNADTIEISGTPTNSGTFNYSIPLTGGCGSVSARGAIKVDICNSIEDIALTKFLVQPNPNRGQFRIISEKGGVFELLDLTGKTINTYQFDSESLEVKENLSAGMYFIRETKSGAVQKLIIE